MPETIEQAQKAIIDDFANYGDWEERYAHLIDIGKQHGDISNEYKIENFRVKGCQSTVHLHPEFRNGIVHFDATSDAMIVRGLIALLMRVYNDRTPDEILNTSSQFIQELGLTENLTQGRQNGLKAMIEQIKLYALAFKTLQQSKLNAN